jgi:hypothetical protein
MGRASAASQLLDCPSDVIERRAHICVVDGLGRVRERPQPLLKARICTRTLPITMRVLDRARHTNQPPFLRPTFFGVFSGACRG